MALIRNSDPDLLSLVGEDVALRYVSGTRGGEYAGPCPFCHEGDDRLRVQPVTNMWYCRECARQGRMDHWEDDISYLRRRDGLGFADACKRLDIEFAPNDEHSGGYTPRNYSFPDLLPTPPCDEWVAAVSAVLAECEECLWSPQSRVTRDWLYQKRSIHEDTARKFRLGRNVVDRIIPGYVRHNERTQRDEPLTLRRGLVIPCYGVDGTLWGVKVKTSPAELAADPSMGRYTSVAGSQAGLQGILSPPRGGMPGRDRIFLCYSADTEVLTTDGWVLFPSLKEDALVAQYERGTGSVAFVRPTAYQRFDYTGDMVHISSDWCDLLVTPDHRMLVRYQNCRDKVVAAGAMVRAMRVPVAGYCEGGSRGPNPDQARLLVSFNADGHWYKRGLQVGWNLKKSRKKDRLRVLLRALGIEWQEQTQDSHPGYTNFLVRKDSLSWLSSWLPGKHWAWESLDWPLVSRQALLHELRHWDGDSVSRLSSRYFTAHSGDAQIVSALAVTSGCGSTIREDRREHRPDYGVHFVVNIVRKTERSLSHTPDIESYSGSVYCCSVPSTFLVVRRQGKVVVAGNCEGELDMIVAHQDYGDIADIATYGSAQVANLHTYWFTFLRNYRQVFLMYDHDSAGRAGARQLLNRLVDLYANTPLGTRIVDVFPDKDWLAKAYPNLEGDITKEPKDVGEIRANGKLESYVQTWLSRFPLEETMSEDTTPTTAPTAPPVAAGEGATGLDPDDEAVLDCMVHAMMLDQGRPLSWIAEQAGLDGEDAADAVASLTLRGFLATTSHPALPKETLYKVIGGPLHDDWMAVPEADRRAEALALVPPRPAARQVATPVDSAEYPDDEIARLLTDDDDNAHIPEDDADYYTEQGSSDPPVVRQMFGYETGSDRGEKVDNVRIVRDADGLREMISHLSGHKLLAVDTETTGLDVYERDMLSLVQIATPERMYVVEARQVDVRPLKGILEDRGVVKILQNANYDYRVLAATTGIRMRSMVDTMLTERILKAGVSRVANLEYLAQSYLGVKLDKGVRNTFIGYRGPFTDDQLAYSAKDVEVLFGIWARQRSLLIRADSMHIANLEFRTLVPVAEMQLAGCAIDKDKWRGLLDKAAEDRLDAQGRLVGLLSGTVSQRTLWGGVMVRQRGSKGRKDRGGEINLGSSQEMLERLREIGLSAVEDGDTATGEALMALESSEEQYLKTIEHPAARTLLEWRGYDKILSAFGENVLKLINPQTGRIHPEFQQLEADTGRFACIAAGQRVSVPGAQIPIEQITVGTPVYAFDDAGQPVIRPVIAVMDNGIRSCVEVRWKARRSDRYGSLTCTPDHLIRTQGKGWVAAGDLLPGDKPLFLAHSVLTVTPVGECHVYDLEVEDAHNFVAEELCVHNCRAPNVQQIPSDSSFRSCFVAPEGYKIVTADYSQAELRILCQLSGDERFTEAFNSGGDLHTLTAMQMYGVSEEHVKANKKLRSNAKCFHPDTEVLTRSGWRRIVDIDETVEVVQATPGPDCEIHLDWAYPLEVFSMEHPSGQLVHLRNEGIDIRVTPDHRMLAFNVNGDHKVVMPGEFGKVRTWANAGILGGHGFSTVPEHVLRLAVATQADGSYDNSGIRFGFSKERKVERLHYLLRGCAYTHGTHANGVRWFRIGGELAGLIKSELDDKCLPWRWVGSLTDIEKSIALDEIRHWDSHERGNWRMFRYSSMVEQNVDVLQALASLTGRKTRKVRSVSGCYNLTVRGTHTSRGGNVETTTIPYTDRVACLSVPSTFVLVRDGGVPVITGQTINFGLAYGQGPGRLAASLGLATKEEAQALIDQYFQAYSGIKRWLEGSARRAVSQGYIESIYGRKRYFTKVPPLGRNASKEARSEHRKAIGRIERQGKNTPIQACVHGDTRVFTEEHGYVAIRDLAGLQVTVWDGERFSHASVFPSGNKRLLTVHLTDGRSIRCSPEHRFWTRDVNGKSFWRTPSEFIQQTRIALADAIPERWSVPVPLPGVTERRVHNGKLIDMGMLGDPYERGIWLGRVASDGDCRNGNQVQLIVAEHEYELLPKLRDLCARFGHVGEYVTPRDAGRASMTRLSIASKGLAQQLCDAGLKRRIPAFVWAESETLRGYLRGLFDGDGGMSPDGATLTFGKAQGKRAWAEDVAEALLLFGIRSRVRSYAGDRTVVQVLKRDMPQFAARIGFLKASKQEMAESVTSSVTESIYGRCATVLRVDDHQEYVPMYDVVNSETGRFAASGLITHNSNADMTKFALCGIHAALEGYDARIVNTVHDEIVVEARDDVADEVMGIVQSEMVRAGQRMITRVPVEADAHVDDCWSKG